MIRWGIISFAVVFAAAGARAQDIPVPADPAAKAAFDMLEKHCSRCHQSGRLKGISQPKKGFGNVLMLDELVPSAKVIAGKPESSPIYEVLMDGSMPADLGESGVKTPTAEEIKAVHDWISSLTGGGICKAPDAREVVTTIAADLDTLPPNRREGTRYLTLTHLAASCTGNQELDVYRKGAVKLLNSLSTRSTVVKLETVDAEKSIIRFNISDLGWSAEDWEHILSIYPYGVRHDSSQFAALKDATGTELPFVRADWFTFEASKPPLYDRLLNLPADFKGLLSQEGIDLEGNIRDFLVKRAAFQNSGVSQNNRLIERHDNRSGYFWTSYDFAGNRDNQNLFKNPLGPGGEFGFRHDGGETIYSLPNGFQAYYLNAADGKRLDKGPINIVQDTTRTGDQSVINGISCMSCHDRGIKMKDDEVRALVIADRSFPNDVVEKVEGLYPEVKDMRAVLEADEARFLNAMHEAGVLEPTRPGEKLTPVYFNKTEMITALSRRYELPVTLDFAAAEFGMDLKTFKEAMQQAGVESLALLRRLEQQGKVPRDNFEDEFLSLVAVVTRDEPIRIAARKDAPVDTKAGPKPGEGFGLTLIADKSRYAKGENAVFSVTPGKNCNLTLVNVDGKGIGTIIFPTKSRPDNALRGGETVHLGAPGTKPSYTLNEPGSETVIAICDTQSAAPRGFESDFKAGGFTDLGDYVTRSTQQAALTAKARQITVDAPGAAPAASTIARASITVEVQ